MDIMKEMCLALKEKLRSITNKICSYAAIIMLLLIWQMVSSLGVVDSFLLPSPLQVGRAFVADFSLLMEHTVITLMEAFVGLLLGVLFGFIMAVLMDRFAIVYKACYPLLVLTQTVPTVAIAPLLVLWFGYEMTPKVILIVIVTFFPLAVGLLDGFREADKDAIHLLRAMGANEWQIFWHIKLPGAMSQFFAGLRIAVSYAVVGAVIAEWLGGFGGLGVYMTRVKQAFAFDKMFAVIFLVSLISLILMKGVDALQRRCTPWKREDGKKG